MYIWSMEYFIKIFIKIIKESAEGRTPEERIRNICNDITYKIFTNINYGLFGKHKIFFCFNLLIKI
jgi:dynein heavy chain